MSILIPGDGIEIVSRNGGEGKEEEAVIGYGIEKTDGGFVANRPGVLRQSMDRHWIAVWSRRYVAERGDRVVGVVMKVQMDSIRIDIGCGEVAWINPLSFEGATKRNRPAVKTGDLVYAQVLIALKYMETELVCVDGEGRGRGMGLLPNTGFTLIVPLNHVRRILSRNCPLLSLIGKEMKYEITAGVNGRIWLNASSHMETVIVTRLIRDSLLVPDSDLVSFVDRTVKELKGI